MKDVPVVLTVTFNRLDAEKAATFNIVKTYEAIQQLVTTDSASGIEKDQDALLAYRDYLSAHLQFRAKAAQDCLATIPVELQR